MSKHFLHEEGYFL